MGAYRLALGMRGGRRAEGMERRYGFGYEECGSGGEKAWRGAGIRHHGERIGGARERCSGMAQSLQLCGSHITNVDAHVATKPRLTMLFCRILHIESI